MEVEKLMMCLENNAMRLEDGFLKNVEKDRTKNVGDGDHGTPC